jgi:hypothetical protein
MSPRLRVVVALIIIAGGAAAFWGLRPQAPKRPPPTESDHGTGIDHSFAGFLALDHAPEGKTPCETAYNAYKASLDAAEAAQARSLVLHLAARDEFLNLCAAFPENEQRCLTPKYLREHRDACPPMTDATELARFKQMVELRHSGQVPAESSERTPEAPAP